MHDIVPIILKFNSEILFVAVSSSANQTDSLSFNSMILYMFIDKMINLIFELGFRQSSFRKSQQAGMNNCDNMLKDDSFILDIFFCKIMVLGN